MKNNVHKIYYIGANKFLLVMRDEGVLPASWTRTVFTYYQLWEEVNYLGIDYFQNKFRNNKRFWLAFKASKSDVEFIQNVRYLMKETPIKGELHEFNRHTKGKGMLIYDYAKSKKLFVVI